MNATIAVLPGDGIGPEVTRSAVRVLQAIGERHGHDFRFEHAAVGGDAIERIGTPLPEDTLALCRRSDAVLLGAVGGPAWSDPSTPVRPEQALIALRAELGLYANLRPVRPFGALADHAPIHANRLQGVDLLFVRELTGGLYYGPRHEAGPDGVAWDTLRYSREEIERVAHQAFRAARSRRGVVHSVDKANVLASMRLWRTTVTDIARNYPDVRLEHVLVDACAMHLITNPAMFDVVLAGNLFGDILSDEAAVLAGSLGMLPSASFGDGGPGLFEPIHGSAPDLTGRDRANPIGAVLSGALLLRHGLDLAKEARQVETAVERVIDTGARTADLTVADEQALGTSAMTDRIIVALETQG